MKGINNMATPTSRENGTFQKGNGGKLVQYPMDVTTLAPQNTMVNVRDGNAQGLAAPTSMMIEDARRDLSVVRVNVAADQWPGWYMEKLALPAQPPEFFFRRGLVEQERGPLMPQFCDMVRMDKPIELFSHILDWLAEQGVELKKQYQPDQGTEFLLYHTDLIECYGKILRVGMRRAGGLKYAFGMQRPEEIWNRAFAAYDCPNHPEFPAWHASFAGLLYALIQHFFDLQKDFVTKREAAPEQSVQEALHDILNVFSHCRDFAGMHFSYSSHIGFNVACSWGAEMLASGAYSKEPFAPTTTPVIAS